MLTSETISEELKSRAQEIIDIKDAIDAARVKLATIIGVAVMIVGLLVSLIDFEYLWYIFVGSIVVGAVVIYLGTRVDDRIPVEALKLYAYGEIIDRLAYEEEEAEIQDSQNPPVNRMPSGKIPAWKQVEMEANGEQIPQSAPTSKPTQMPAPVGQPADKIPAWKRVQMENNGQ